MSTLARWYDSVYGALAGRHPRLRPWHFQWLAVRDLYSDLRRTLPRLQGRVVDVGCGDKPYEPWAAPTKFFGIDVVSGPRVDQVIVPGERWPFADASVDGVLCTQVLEHAETAGLLISEIRRVLAPGGLLVLSVPFIYNAHGEPQDFRRLSIHGVSQVLEGFEILELRAQGGVGSTIGVLALNWVDLQTSRWFTTRLLKGVLLPLWLLGALVVNTLGALLDAIDRTDAFYGNVFVIARKPADAA